MANTTTSAISTTRSNFLIRELLERAYPWFIHTLFAQVKPLPRNVGIAVRFRKYTSLTAATTALTEGVTPDSTTLAYTDLNATPLQYGQPLSAVLKSFLILLFQSQSTTAL